MAAPRYAASHWSKAAQWLMGQNLTQEGVAHAGFGLWYGPEDKLNKRLPVPSTEKQTIDRAELYGVLTAVENKTPSTTTCRD